MNNQRKQSLAVPQLHRVMTQICSVWTLVDFWENEVYEAGFYLPCSRWGRIGSMQRQLMAYHPRIGYRFIPGLQTRELHEGGGFLLRTNGAGYRCRHEFEKQKKPGTFRILVEWSRITTSGLT